MITDISKIKMMGIIYKFTILAKYKMDDCKPFYVGQHVGIEDFDSYWGSGTIWNDFLDQIKQEYPKHWTKFIKREILFQRECTQKVLDAMEMYYIKKEKANYSYRLGGCNVLWGTANNFGSGSPMKDDGIRKRKSEYMKEYYKTHKHPCIGKKASEELREKLRKSHLGKRNTDEVIRRISEKNRGKKRSKEFCERMKELWVIKRRSGYIPPTRGRKVPDDIRERRAEGVRRYYKTHSSSFKGKRHTEEAKRKMSISAIGKRKGFLNSEETKRKMSISAKLAWQKRKQGFNK